MNIFNFIKNAWKFRNELSAFKSTDARYSLNLMNAGIKELIEKYSEEIPDAELKSMRAFEESSERLVTDDFLKSSCTYVLEGDFNESEYDAGKFDYLMSLPVQDREAIFKMADEKEKFTISVMTSAIKSDSGIKNWFTTPTEK